MAITTLAVPGAKRVQHAVQQAEAHQRQPCLMRMASDLQQQRGHLLMQAFLPQNILQQDLRPEVPHQHARSDAISVSRYSG